MRLLITLKALKSCAYDLKYYHKLRGFIYGLQRDSPGFNRHELKGYKYFSFSNIFPAKDMAPGELRSLIISSPSKDFIYWLRGNLTEMQETTKEVEIGEMQFVIQAVRGINPKAGQNCKLITGTPIILRIPKEKYNEYGIDSSRPYEYWRPQYSFDAFLKQLNDNLLKKYEQYYGEKIINGLIFERFKFKREVCVHRIEEGIEIPTVGTLWEFEFGHLDPQRRKILELGLDSGLGELNSSGFGFMNICREKPSRREQQGDLDAIPATHLRASE